MPSIMDGLFAGRAGIQSHGTAISVLADNISNQNTVGFKQSRPDFADLLAGTLNGAGGAQTGSGSQVIGITQILNQGTFEFTGRGLDVGIDGNGFLVVEDTSGTGQRLYTRAGNFRVDTEGNLLDQNGYYVMGFPSTGAGGLQQLNVNDRAQSSVATEELTISGNLDASAPLTPGLPPAGASYQDLANAAQFSTFCEVYDSLGGSHTMTVYFFHTAQNQWVARSVVDSGDLGAAAGDPVIQNDTNLVFGSDGLRVVGAVPDGILSPVWGNGSTAGNIELTYTNYTQFASSSAVSSIYQDGTGTGSVVGFNIEPDGTLFAQLDNGQTASIGTIALAVFANGEGLQRVGNSLFAETSRSGEPVIGSPNTGTFGSLESGALELSTADLAADFVKLISLQRGFQGSSRIITNIDDLLNEIINLA